MRKDVWFGIFLFFLVIAVILSFNSFSLTLNNYNDGNISFQYPLGFEKVAPFPNLYGEWYSIGWIDVICLNGETASIGVSKRDLDGYDNKKPGVGAEKFFRDMGDNIISSSNFTNQNDVNMFKIVHRAKKDNYKFIFYDVNFIQANSEYLIQVIGTKETELSAQKVAESVFNTIKVLK